MQVPEDVPNVAVAVLEGELGVDRFLGELVNEPGQLREAVRGRGLGHRVVAAQQGGGHDLAGGYLMALERRDGREGLSDSQPHSDVDIGRHDLTSTAARRTREDASGDHRPLDVHLDT
ncbi:MAG: hypothetical protein LBK95_01320 [Bifidobacteriaceae bacterium]|nr:hypothetical protein [Bifidobacteriaceae bacterium]